MRGWRMARPVYSYVVRDASMLANKMSYDAIKF